MDLGVVKELEDDNYVLLEVAEEGGARPSGPRAGTFDYHSLDHTHGSNVGCLAAVEEQPSVLSVQQQQAEQMKIYWKVCSALSPTTLGRALTAIPVHRRHAHELRISAS